MLLHLLLFTLVGFSAAKDTEIPLGSFKWCIAPGANEVRVAKKCSEAAGKTFKIHRFKDVAIFETGRQVEFSPEAYSTKVDPSKGEGNKYVWNWVDTRVTCKMVPNTAFDDTHKVYKAKLVDNFVQPDASGSNGLTGFFLKTGSKVTVPEAGGSFTYDSGKTHSTVSGSEGRIFTPILNGCCLIIKLAARKAEIFHDLDCKTFNSNSHSAGDPDTVVVFPVLPDISRSMMMAFKGGELQITTGWYHADNGPMFRAQQGQAPGGGPLNLNGCEKITFKHK